MAVAVDPTHAGTYVLKADRKLPPEQQTRWKMRPLKATARAVIEDAIAVRYDDGTRAVRIGTTALEILRQGLVGWENFKDADGRDIEPEMTEDGQIKDVSLDWIKQADRTELTDAITELAFLSEDDEKN